VFPPEQVDATWLYEWEQSSLGQDWEPLDEFRTIQQVDLAEKLFEVTEHRARLYRHVSTGKVVAAPLPREVLEAGLLGPRLSALVAYQKGACHMSYTSIRGFLGGVLHVDVSRGQLAKTVQKVSAALAGSHEELKAALLEQSTVNVDETGHPENGEKLWTWDFHVPGPKGFTFFHIDPSRSSEVLKDFLGETFGGVVGCDYLSAYRKFLKDTEATLQFCWAHLVRDVKFLTKLPDPVTQRFGERLLDSIKVLFQVWHRRGQAPDKRWKRDAKRAEQAVLKMVRYAPQRTEAQNMAQRFREHGDYYFTFLRVPGVEPTNNAAERAFRFVVIDRRITQGTRGENGRRWCERIWSVVATCAQRGRSAFEFILQSVLAHFHGLDAPSLLAIPP
jgi:transposase